MIKLNLMIILSIEITYSICVEKKHNLIMILSITITYTICVECVLKYYIFSHPLAVN